MWVMASGVWEMPGPGVPVDRSGEHAYQCAAVVGGEHGEVVALEVLVLRGDALLRPGQVDPQLQAVEQATGLDQRRGRGLDVQEAVTRGHVLRAAVVDRAATAVRVLVDELAVDEVRERLEAAVRVPGRALRLAGGVLHLAHLVHVDERVEDLHRHPAKARCTGNPSPSNPVGAVVTDVTDRAVDSAIGVRRGRVRVSAVTAGMGSSSGSSTLSFNYRPRQPIPGRRRGDRQSSAERAAMKALELELNSSQSTRRSTPMASAACTR